MWPNVKTKDGHLPKCCGISCAITEAVCLDTRLRQWKKVQATTICLRQWAPIRLRAQGLGNTSESRRCERPRQNLMQVDHPIANQVETKQWSRLLFFRG